MARDLRLITFRIGAENFAADVMALRQVVPYEGATALPNAPPFVEGVIVFRGEVVPVVDLRARFFPGSGSAATPLVLIAMGKSGTIGLKVDEVRTLAKITTDDLLPAPATVRGVKDDYLVAVVEHREDLLLVLDLDAILTTDEQKQLATFESSSPTPQISR